MKEQIKNRIPLCIFLLFFIIAALITFKDFGITWDERLVYTWGESLFRYLLGQSDPYGHSLISGQITHYSNIYAAVLYAINKISGSVTMEKFHLMNILFSIPLFIASYELLISKYKNKWLATIGPIFILLIPRFTGDLPTNAKDGSLAVVYFLSLTAIYYFANSQKTLFKILILGFLFGLTQNFRFIGFTIYLVYIFYILYNYLVKNSFDKKFFKFIFNEGLQLIIIACIALLLMLLTWPYLGENFILHFKEILEITRNFPWTNLMLFNGKQISATDIPLTYLPVWLLITTPIFILFYFFTSFIFVKERLKNNLYILFSLALITNIIFYYLFKPIIYDGLRHFLFLLPIIGFIAAISFIEFIHNINLRVYLRKNFFKFILIILTILNILIVIYNLVVLHPYQYVYFNEFVGGLKGAQDNYETDYWGASFKEGIEWLKVNKINNENKIYNIKTCANPYQSTYHFSSNMVWVNDIKTADYFICYTRGNEHKNTIKSAGKDMNIKVIHTVSRNKVNLLYIYKVDRK